MVTLVGFFDPPWSEPVDGLSDAAKGLVLSAAGFHLRALGRLSEAIEPMKAALRATVNQEDWQNAAKDAGNLSSLQCTLGRIAAAIESAEQSGEYASLSQDVVTQMLSRTWRANALYQAGRLDEAEHLFRRAEEMQRDREPEFPLLYSVHGHLYCKLLLARGHYEDVLNRAAQTISWGKEVFGFGMLSIALDHLSLARASLMAAQSGRVNVMEQPRAHVQAAVETLRKAGTQHHIPGALLARAEFYRFTGERDAARRDLDEAWDIATRDPAGQMKLFMADVHLVRARLDLDDGLTDDARGNIAAAAALIEETGYHRRDGELAELQERLQANGGREPTG